ncbi:hypothetical protein Sjap_024772 [Stephania japonica]|uniref:Uncharacterized protein n=1 Tax=Stephania japonica TaxID=461633 RepID=A0AAP0EG64_9MAGN
MNKISSSKKAQDAKQALLNRATSPQTGQQTRGSLKSKKDKSNQQEKDAQEGSLLKLLWAWWRDNCRSAYKLV